MRIGFGSDVHAFGPGDSVMIAGVRVPHSRGVIAHSDGDVALRWRRGDRWSIAARGTAFETISEWRVGTGRVVGGGADVSFALRPDLNLVADAMLYRQRENGRAAEGPWNQKRAMIRLEWNVRGDPGATAREAKR